MTAPLLQPGDRIGPYIVAALIEEGKGGTAQVYRAHVDSAPGSGRGVDVALKVALPPRRNRSANVDAQDQLAAEALQNEVEILRQLRHPYIVKIHSIPWGEKLFPYIARAQALPGEPWFCALEYLAGGSLQQRFSADRIAFDQALRLTYQIAAALDYLHAKGYAHLDLKPDNILFRESWTAIQPDAVLIDFGIARRIKQPLIYAGTTQYLSPERVRQMLGQASPDTDQRPSDVYALGLILYRLLTGGFPFKETSRERAIKAILTEEPLPPSQINTAVSSELERTIIASLAKRPQARPSITDFTTTLEHAVRARPRVEQPERGRNTPISLPEQNTIGSKREKAPSLQSDSRSQSARELRLRGWLARVFGAPATSVGPHERRAGRTADVPFHLPEQRLFRSVNVTRLMLVAAIIGLVGMAVGGLATLTFANWAANEAERAIATYPFDWMRFDANSTVTVSEDDLQSYLDDSKSSITANYVRDVIIHVHRGNLVQIVIDTRELTLDVHLRMTVETGVPQITLELVNGMMFPFVGEIVSGGINRGLKRAFADAPVAFDRIVTTERSLTLYPKKPMAASPSKADELRLSFPDVPGYRVITETTKPGEYDLLYPGGYQSGRLLLVNAAGTWTWLRALGFPTAGTLSIWNPFLRAWEHLPQAQAWLLPADAVTEVVNARNSLSETLPFGVFRRSDDKSKGLIQVSSWSGAVPIGEVAAVEGHYYFFVSAPRAFNGVTHTVRFYGDDLAKAPALRAAEWFGTTPTPTRVPLATATSVPTAVIVQLAPTATPMARPLPPTNTPRPTNTPEPAAIPTTPPPSNDPLTLYFIPQKPQYLNLSTTLSVIRGKVTDLTGVGIPGIKVEIEGGAIAPTRTDDNGDYSFKDMLPRKYNIRLIELPKATPASQVDVPSHRTVIVNFKACDESCFYTPTPTPTATATRAGGIYTQPVLDVAIDPADNQMVYALVRDKGIYRSVNGGAFWEQSFANGSARSILIDKSNPSIVYVSTWNGVLKTTNKGGSWAVFYKGLPLNQIVNVLVMDPANNSVIYAGTDGGVFKSMDAAQSWEDVSNRLNGFKIYAMAIDPSNGGVIYAAVEGSRLFKTTNSGATWEELSYNVGSAAYSVAIDPRNPERVYAGINTSSTRFIRSSDGGSTWQVVGNGLQFPLIPGVIAFHPTQSIMYLGTGYLGNAGANGLYRSTDGGASWQSWSNGIPRTGGALPFVQGIAVDPANPSVMFAATGVGLFKSVNGGQTWQQL